MRRIRHGGLRPECQACSPQRAHTDIEHPSGEEIQWDWLELREDPVGLEGLRAGGGAVAFGQATVLVGGGSCGGGPVGEPVVDDMTGPADRVRAQL